MKYLLVLHLAFLLVNLEICEAGYANDKALLPYVKMAKRVLDLVSPASHLSMTRTYPEANMTAPEIITYFGYPVEIHKVRTRDGYLLELHRIPSGINEHKEHDKLPRSYERSIFGSFFGGGQHKKTPVLLNHMLLGSSAIWLLNTKNNTLPFLLADSGYDVWLLNPRGNTYSREHSSRLPNETSFWEFSFEDVAAHDLPSILNFVTRKTGVKKVHFIGHGTGATSVLALLADQPRYKNKIQSIVAISPVVTLRHTTSMLRHFRYLQTPLEVAAKLIRLREVLPQGTFSPLVNPSGTDHVQFVNRIFHTLGAGNDRHYNMSRLSVYMSHFPAGTSLKNMLHLVQLMRTGRFEKYDYGIVGNMYHYYRFHPTVYNLEKVTTPTILVWSDHDVFCGPRDIGELQSLLPNIVGEVHIKENFGHADYLFSNRARQLYFDQILSKMHSVH